MQRLCIFYTFQFLTLFFEILFQLYGVIAEQKRNRGTEEQRKSRRAEGTQRADGKALKDTYI